MQTPFRTPVIGVAILLAAVVAGPVLGQFTFHKIELKSNITIAQLGSARGSDCWGYVSPSGREYALMCTKEALAVIEVTNPTSPVIIEQIFHIKHTAVDVKVYQQYAYVVNGAGGGIDVIDLGNVDSGQVTLVRQATPGGLQRAHNIAINEDSGFLYLGIGNINSGELVALSLADPTNPAIAGAYTGDQSHDLQVITYTSGPNAGREIAFSFSENRGVDIIDVTDKSSMVLLSRSTYPTTMYCHQGWVSEDRQYLYLNDELDQMQRTTVFDISDLNAPIHMGSFSSSAASNTTDHNLYIRDGFIYEANDRSGLRIFDANIDPINPPEIGWFDTYPGGNGHGSDGAWSVYPYFPSGNIIVSDRQGGLFVLDPSEALFGTTAPLIDVTRTLGLFVSGGATEVLASDDAYFVLQSGPGFSPMEPHPAAADFRFDSLGFAASTLDVTLEEKANIGGPIAVVLLRNQTTSSWDEIARHGLSPTDQTFETSGIPAADYVGGGNIEVRVRSFAILILNPTIRGIFSHDFVGVRMRE